MSDARRWHSGALVSSRSLVALDRAARALGIELDIAKLAPSFDPGDSSGTLPLEEQIAYCRALFRDPREALGLELAKHLPLESTGLWGFLLRSSSTFGEMLARAQRYQRIVNAYEEFALEDLGDQVAMVSRHPNPSPFGERKHAVVLMLCHWLVWGRQLSGHPMAVVSASFQCREPKSGADFEAFFQGPVLFGSRRDMIVLPKSYLSLPYRDSAPELSTTFESYAATLVSRLTLPENMIAKVRVAIESGLLTGASSESDVATSLGMTPRTLHRHLTASGTSFRQVKHEVIQKRAEELLFAGELPLSEISYLLGFSEPSSFHRAFRRWTGKTPGAWRKAQVGA